ncbi:hypothetical protein JHK86_020323 [Glycine max]|nr:hypothetical protein JHK86_020323 [Glycine max]
MEMKCVSYEDIFIGVNGADKENDPTDHMDWIFDSDFDEEDSIEEEPVGMDVSSGSILYNYGGFSYPLC